MPGVPGKRIGIVTGNLRHANLNARLRNEPIDVWVNSENINMAMARPYEGNISGLIRYLGARRDETGTIVKDVIADELMKKMRGASGGESRRRSSPPTPAGSAKPTR